MAQKANKTFHIIGRVIDRTTRQGVLGLRVEGWDKDLIFHDLVGSAMTDEQGAFRIEFEASYFKELFLDRQPDLFFRIYRDNSLIKSTEDSVLWNVRAEETEVVVEVDIPIVADPEIPIVVGSETFVVRGQIRLSDGSPCAGALVCAYDKYLRSKEPLGKPKPATTDTEGRYEITYTAEQFSRVEKHSADLLVEARQNEAAGWIAAPIRYNAQPVEIVDVTLDGVYRGPSEFRRLVDEITPLLDGLTMAQLTENGEFQDITSLSNETGIDRQRIAWLAVSALRAQEQDLLPHEECYGLFCQNLPTELDALLAQETAALRTALEFSANGNIVRPMLEHELDDFVARVQKLKAGQALRLAEPNQPSSLGDLLSVAINIEKHGLIADFFVQYGGATDTFWKALEDDSDVELDDLKALKQTIALDTFTDNHLPLVRELYQMGKGNPAFAEQRSYAQFDEPEWQALLQRPQEPGNPDSMPIGFPPGQESIVSYARTLNQSIENAFPTAVIANRLERDDSDESPFKATKSDLLMFFANNPAFSFSDTPPDVYLSDGASEKLRDIENPQALKAQLKSMKRAFNVTQSFPGINAFLADGLDSSTAMTYLGERKFTERYGEPLGGIDKAREVFRRAKHVHATVVNVYMKHAEAFNSPTPYVIPGGEMERSVAPNIDGVMEMPVASAFLTSNTALRMNKLSTGADLRNLFGSLDLCNCQHCLSLYSPAAYLVDILKFLGDGPVNDDGLSPLQVLLARRPDIGHIELTCENTNTQFPYVDLVNEVLEEALMPSQMGHWEFDEGQGKTALDASANGNNGTLQALSGSGPIWETGKIGTNSLSFNGTYDYVQIPANKGQTLTDIGSICAWIYPKGVGSLSPRGTIIAKQGEFIISWQLSSKGGAIDWRFPNRQPSELWHAAGGYIAPVNKWTHLAVVFDKGKVKTYANGLLVDDASGTGSIGLASSEPKEITIGGQPGVAYFYGLIDDVRLYDGALNEEEVRTSAEARTSRQTRGTAEELAANPEYITISAYERLSKAVYPWNLPLNLPLEEVRAYLGHLGVQRHEVIQTLLASKAAFDKDFALEYLGLAKEEADIITGVTTGGPAGTPTPVGDWDFWGLRETGNDIVDRNDGTALNVQGDWDVVLQRVSIFLQQSGLSYRELLELLGTYFINPPASAGTPGGRLLGIAPPVICNLSKLEIQVVDDKITSSTKDELIAVWNRIHRFVRLWRKLGWTMRDLDKAIKALSENSDGQIDIDFDALLKNLANIQWLHVETSLPVVNLLAWREGKDIDTVSYVDQMAGV